MKKITFLVAMLLISIVTFSQVIDRPINGVTSLISINGTNGDQIFVGDSFTLVADTDLGELDVFGTNSNAVLAPNLIGFSVYIYTEDLSLPSSDPTVVGAGVVEIPLVDMANITVLADEDPTVIVPATSNYTLDLVAANGGTAITLPTGDYWLVVAAVTNDPPGDGRWNWQTSAEVAAVEPVIIDPLDLFGLGVTSWTSISELTGNTVTSFAWQLREPADGFTCGTALTVTEGMTTSTIVDTGGSSNSGDSVWYAYTASGDGTIDITSCGDTNDIDTRLFVYDGCGNSSIAENDDGCGDITPDPDTFESAVLALPVTMGSTVYIQWDDRWVGSEDTAFDWEITFTPLACGEPTDGVISAITINSATFGWTAGPNAETMWDVELGLIGFAPGTGAEIEMATDITTNTYDTTTTLTDETTYEFYVRAGCNTTDYSTWAGPFEFTTEAMPITLTCGDNYYDTGGQAGDYSNDESVTTIVMPDTAGEVVTVTFTYVDIEVAATVAGTQDGCWDFLTIYDGPDTSAPVLAATLCGETDGDGGVPNNLTSELIPGMSFTSTHASGALTFVFTSDINLSETGWEADVTCAVASVANNVIEGFDFYPNPAKNTINLTALNTIDNVEVFNMVGQKVISQNLSTTTGQLDISKLSTGMYVMKVTSNNQVGSYQIVKK